MTEPIHVNVPGGIGDISWSHSKLVPLGRPIYYHVARRQIESSLDYCNILDGVVGAETGAFVYKQIKDKTPDPTQPLPDVFDTMCLNDFLGAGNRLETAYPGTETEFHYNFNLSPIHEHDAMSLVEGFDPDTKFFGIYTSEFQMTKSWKGWQPSTWIDFINRFREPYGDHWVPVIIGADFDAGFTVHLKNALISQKTPFVYLVGHHIGSVVAFLQEYMSFLVGFNSGICVLSNVCRVPCLMQYPSFLKKLRKSWPDLSVPYRAIDFVDPLVTLAEIEENFMLE